MNILFIGGTGNLSLDCSLRAISQGHRLYHLNRGHSPLSIPGVQTIVGDMNDEAAIASKLAGMHFDAVVEFIAFSPDQVERDIRLFTGKTKQYLFISTASAYRKPPVHHVMTEATPLENPYWDYSAKKIACERILERAYRASGFPVTIVRPSHTYSSRWIPTAWSSSDFTVAARMLAGKEVIVHGDGQSLWTLTHTKDFAVGLVGLLGNPAAIGEAFQITGDQALTWEAIHMAVAAALGVEARIVHVPSDFIAAVDPEMGAHFLGDKACSALFDCSKLKRLVPEFRTTIPFHQGVRESVAWYLADPARQRVNEQIDEVIERVLSAWHRGMQAALS
ncbi:SDR family oxidoreductase [Sediminispirochaeta smaragdinae]|jgi:nucleoside-diphosphate-sugar epimerase|uniref:NAD-dependent epimerase/dehydratase n=1 Tax=Sediminispirochaeta smaragdinae (strain DSM 11293 / JCM 15392 / SEBR 4228) TaxID=573413 RepID=E1RCD9_SEDSS|nr:SDR family oxidoreductase [Sediminispirochaeta smaragdinae]ADK80019.1 NAD-dependent epimerase/dehydratase [Sediminispirochaeta smaragdinae DSM 11293]